MKTQNEVDDPNLAADARNSLLAHYSSKSTNETTILLGLAVAFFADVQTYNAFSFVPEWLRIVFLISSLGVIAYLVIRQTSRLVYWGELTTAILIVGMFDLKPIEDDLKKTLTNLYSERNSALSKSDIPKVPLVATDIDRLSSSTYWYFKEKKRASKEWHMRFYSLVTNRRFALTYFILLSIASILLGVWSGLFLHS
ncbi:MAG: hypothetical protein ABSD73_10310 [Candidatus Bathyarchaeia archaeon]